MNLIKEKSFQFSLKLLKFSKTIHGSDMIVKTQLIRAGTSIGANVREAINAESKADFIHKLQISQKECDEACYWLQLLAAMSKSPSPEISGLEEDTREMLRILRSIILTTRKNLKK